MGDNQSNMAHSIQVNKEHYFRLGYVKKERWANFWRQIHLVVESDAKSTLEVGIGSGIVADALRKMGLQVQTLDIDPALQPDIVGSVTAIPLPDKAVDTALAAEVLEHLPWEEVPRALAELRRIARRHVVVTLPYAGSIIAFTVKIPLTPWMSVMVKMPHFWKKHVFDGQHYWELGKRDRSLSQFHVLLKDAGFTVREEGHTPDDPSHYYFLLSV
ncbi:methyltransferase type 11 [Candidatus Kaiserbacteria bacterium CG10_big_fil_rev_8_21_14_0_10_59_10]|uniref:Methyltransferase type 11 n=1 Tax=Candidatus Kaiserbacteria bacterium CG10_big_fil_rev_8_21_14_0_10_59_10 TaxID=1974612 RepID=A0A2H0U9U4_9BACT|nr:MAG: methyltransferase type 11 [Candidatus Kaiserbacteria bacterium CG10_big_fil_rev_8_21_14_0_10_59_10]